MEIDMSDLGLGCAMDVRPTATPIGDRRSHITCMTSTRTKIKLCLDCSFTRKKRLPTDRKSDRCEEGDNLTLKSIDGIKRLKAVSNNKFVLNKLTILRFKD